MSTTVLRNLIAAIQDPQSNRQDVAASLLEIADLIDGVDWATWTPATVSSGSMTYTITTNGLTYKVKDNHVLFTGRIIGDSSGTASPVITLTGLPFPSIGSGSGVPSNGIACTFRNAGSTTNVLAHCFIQGSVMVFRKQDASNFGIGSDLGFGIFGGYRIA